MADRDLLDADLAIMIATAPLWLTYFAVLIVAGAWNDWRAR